MLSRRKLDLSLDSSIALLPKGGEMRAAAATNLICVFLSLVLLLQLHTPTSAAEKRSYVVYMGAHSHGKTVSPADLHQVTESHYTFLQSFLERSEEARDAIFYSYTRHINGFAAILDDEKAAQIARHPNVVSVFLNQGRKLYTTRSWEFMGLEDDGVIRQNSIWEKARFGEDAIIGNLDSGVFPESMSFSDEGLGPVPSKWKGICQNDIDRGFHCNRKLVGARYFNKGYAAVVGSLDPSYDSPRDTDGHGSHTLSTAGGSFVPGANVFGYGNGTAKGGSPKARVAAYKVCWPPVGGEDCYDADILAAFDVAIDDGVDVLSVSLGMGAVGFFKDAAAIGSFHAVKHGIVVVCAAGNSGPNAGTVSNVAPWQFTVGASTMDRRFPNYVTLGNKLQFKGEGISLEALPNKEFYPVIRSKDVKAADAYEKDAELCKAGSLDPSKVEGKILVCLVGGIPMADKGKQALSAGAVGTERLYNFPARTQDNKLHAMTNSSHLKASPFSYGAGHVQPNRAMNPGLVYDLTVDDYLTFLCSLNYNQSQITLFSEEPYSCPKKISLTDFNYPSITIPNLNGSITVTRKVKNVGSPGTYKARVVRPSGITVSVQPKSLKFDKIGEEKSFKLKLKLKQTSAAKEYVFGKLIWSDGKHNVRSPIVVKAV
ncbi:Xylem serine proteinase 1 [Heracleum sosnowskyi]|uniref:Xylem serine proteinase 1 n=1 Tax=Heracleum sosnowskyi TaxID=360622 RepID=A0AAD8LZB1_9APIA|nr:Xylem serine proteinase 1 [Heracleum sosnowskyi]